MKDRPRDWLARRDPDAHKGNFGHVLLVAGSRGMTGAAVLAGRAALRAGAGLVTIAAPASQQPVVAAQSAEALTLPLPESGGAISAAAAAVLSRHAAARRCTVLTIGPGLGTSPSTTRAVVSILRGLDLPAVVDADALNALARVDARRLFLRRRSPSVLTPHPGEMARLVSSTAALVQQRRSESARRLAEAWRCVCVLKGRGTVISDGARTTVNDTGNPGLAKGGTGDVLTGVIAGLWAQRPEGAFEVAALGAWLHGAAADRAVERTTERALLASDVIEALPEAFRALARRR